MLYPLHVVYLFVAGISPGSRLIWVGGSVYLIDAAKGRGKSVRTSVVEKTGAMVVDVSSLAVSLLSSIHMTTRLIQSMTQFCCVRHVDAGDHSSLGQSLCVYSVYAVRCKVDQGAQA